MDEVPPALLPEISEQRPGGVDRAQQVDIYLPLERSNGDTRQWSGTYHPRAVHQGIHAAEGHERPRYQLVDRVGVGHIDGDRNDAVPGGGELNPLRLQGRLVDVGEDEFRPFAGKPSRGRRPDPAR